MAEPEPEVEQATANVPSEMEGPPTTSGAGLAAGAGLAVNPEQDPLRALQGEFTSFLTRR